MPRRDNSTRWNSWYEMIDRAIRHLKTLILQTVHEEPSLTNNSLSHSNWLILTNIRDFLQAFYDTTKATKGRRASLDLVLPSLDFLVTKFEEAKETYADHSNLFIRSSLQAS